MNESLRRRHHIPIVQNIWPTREFSEDGRRRDPSVLFPARSGHGNAKYLGKGKPIGRGEFDKVFGHLAAVTVSPANCFGPELIDACLDAKVILFERGFHASFKSFDRIIADMYSRQSKPLPWTLDYTDPWWVSRSRIQTDGTW